MNVAFDGKCYLCRRAYYGQNGECPKCGTPEPGRRVRGYPAYGDDMSLKPFTPAVPVHSFGEPYDFKQDGVLKRRAERSAQTLKAKWLLFGAAIVVVFFMFGMAVHRGQVVVEQWMEVPQ